MARRSLIFLTLSRLAKLAPLLTLVYFMGLVYALLYPFQFSLPDSHKPFLSFNMLNTGAVPYLVKNSNRIDIMANIAFFAPFGAFLYAWLQARIQSSTQAILCAVIAAGLVSVGCEAIQFFEPARDSAIFDVGSNVIGAAAGAISCWFWFLLAEKLRSTRKLVQ